MAMAAEAPAGGGFTILRKLIVSFNFFFCLVYYRLASLLQTVVFLRVYIGWDGMEIIGIGIA